MKKVLSIILCALMVLSAIPASADPIWDAIMNIPRNEAPDVYLNSVEISFDGDAFPQNVNGRVLVPFRAIAESYGAEVLYDEETKAITATRGDITISFRNGDYNMTVTENGVESTVAMDVCPTLNTQYSRTMVPIRFLSEAFGLSVGWTGKDVIVADFRGLMERIVAENALLTAILEIRAESSDAFSVERTGSREEGIKGGDAEEINKTEWNGTETVSPEGYSFAGEGDYILPTAYIDGETFLQFLAERWSVSAKSDEELVEDAVLMLEAAHTDPHHYKSIEKSLFAANLLYAKELVKADEEGISFARTAEEYRAYRIAYYEAQGMAEEELNEVKETLKNVSAEYRLEAVFDGAGNVTSFEKEYSRNVTVDVLFGWILEQETVKRK